MATTSKRHKRIPAMQTFREQIELAMHQRGWNTKDLSDKSGVTRAYIYRVLNGSQNPSMEVADKLAAALGLMITTAPAK